MISRYEEILKSLFKKVYLLSSAPLENRLLAFEIQRELLKRILASEKRIKLNKDRKKLLKKDLANRQNSRAASNIIKKQIKQVSDNIERQNFLLWVYRTIGDSVAFIYGDRWDLKQYVFKQNAGFISGKTGLKLERGILNAAFKSGATVVMNDLTNTMRHGDITIFRPDLWPDGGSPALFIEAKSGNGGNKKRAKRQEEAIKSITDYIYSDKRVVENGQYLRVAPNEAPTYYNTHITKMASQLKNKGWLHKELESGLHYLMVDVACTDFFKNDILSSIFGNFSKMYMLSVNGLKKKNLGYYPFPLSIKDEDVLFKFYNGEFVLFIIVDMDRLNEITMPHGLRVDCTDDDSYPWSVTQLNLSDTKEKIESYVGFHVIGRLASEFISLKWIADNVILDFHEKMQDNIMEQLSGI